jgi:hypothetical protein
MRVGFVAVAVLLVASCGPSSKTSHARDATAEQAVIPDGADREHERHAAAVLGAPLEGTWRIVRLESSFPLRLEAAQMALAATSVLVHVSGEAIVVDAGSEQRSGVARLVRDADAWRIEVTNQAHTILRSGPVFLMEDGSWRSEGLTFERLRDGHTRDAFCFSEDLRVLERRLACRPGEVAVPAP